MSETTKTSWGPTRKPRSQRTAESTTIDAPTIRPDRDDQTPRAPIPSDSTEIKASKRGIEEAVVGWLVIVEGPGKGADFRIVSGINSVGKGGSARIRLEFGDKGIEEGAHCRVTFDPRSGGFYLSPGDGRFICYSNNKPVLSALELEPMQDIVLGDTTLRFVPFCSPNFNWAEDGRWE